MLQRTILERERRARTRNRAWKKMFAYALSSDPWKWVREGERPKRNLPPACIGPLLLHFPYFTDNTLLRAKDREGDSLS